MNGSNKLWSLGWRNYVLLLLAGVLLGGCQSALLTSSGRMVPASQRIELAANGTQSGSWATRDLSINYRCVESSGQLQILGNIQFGDYLRNGYRYIVYFHSGVLLLDAQGRVLANRSLTTTNAYANSTQLVPFKRTFDLPAGTTAIAFTYTGQARSVSSDNGGGGTSFYHYP